MEYDTSTDGEDDFSEGLARVGKNDADENWKYGYIDKSGEVVLPLEYDYAEYISEELFKVVEVDVYGNWKAGYINKNGEVVVPLELGYVDSERSFVDGLMAVGKQDADGDSHGI